MIHEFYYQKQQFALAYIIGFIWNKHSIIMVIYCAYDMEIFVHLFHFLIICQCRMVHLMSIIDIYKVNMNMMGKLFVQEEFVSHTDKDLHILLYNKLSQII